MTDVTEKALVLLAEQDSGALVAGTPWTRAQAITLVRTVAPGLTPEEFQLFAARCDRTGLDPFIGQIHAVVRGKGEDRKLSIQTGIDGLRHVAHRTGQCAGIDEPTFTYAEADKARKQPLTASATVWRFVQGQRVSFTATCHWSEYVPAGKAGFMWSGKPHVMLGKCAEAQALRRAFPAETSNMYAEEEMARTEDDGRAPSVGAADLEAALSAPASAKQAAAVGAEIVGGKEEPQGAESDSTAPQRGPGPSSDREGLPESEPKAPASSPPLENEQQAFLNGLDREDAAMATSQREFQAMCAAYKAHLGEAIYHGFLRPFGSKSNAVPAGKYAAALAALHGACEALGGPAFPSPEALREAQAMSKEELREGIPFMEGRCSVGGSMREAYLGEAGLDGALVAPLRVYYAVLGDMLAELQGQP